MVADRSLKDLLRRLSDLSVERAYDPYREFDWPETLPDGAPWMSEDLLSVSGTAYMAELSPEQIRALSRHELVNFFSFNVHGIRDLMLHVLSCIHSSGYEDMSEYFHHFIDEENKHMWFFAEFCKRYGGKIYVTKTIQFPAFAESEIQTFVAFAKILISEQISDFYNVRMMNDRSLPPIVMKINRVHHEDESRHLAMGRRIVRNAYEAIAAAYPAETCARIRDYLVRYMQFFVQSFYNPSVYRDAGLPDPYGMQAALVKDPARIRFHEHVLKDVLRAVPQAVS